MRIGTLALGGAAMLLATAAATAGGTKSAPGLTASETVAGRQAAFRLSAALFGSIKGAINRGDEAKTQAFAARAIAGWAKALPGMFPAEAEGVPSKALPTVWSDRAGFEAKATAYAAAAEKLAALADAGDKPGFAAQFAVVGGTCGGCHDSYRAK